MPCNFLVEGPLWAAVLGAPEEGRGWESSTHVCLTEPREGMAILRGQGRFQGARAGVSEEHNLFGWTREKEQAEGEEEGVQKGVLRTSGGENLPATL